MFNNFGGGITRGFFVEGSTSAVSGKSSSEIADKSEDWAGAESEEDRSAEVVIVDNDDEDDEDDDDLGTLKGKRGSLSVSFAVSTSCSGTKRAKRKRL